VQFGADRLGLALTAIDPDWPVAEFCVAFSGGLDSTVLLHTLAQLASVRALRLRAVHVDHGLQPESGAWAEACRTAGRAAGVTVEVLTLGLVPLSGESVEAVARDARYGALARQLKPREWLLTAHHRDDQLETVFIQLLRGAGVPGLAAMPARVPFGPGYHARPLLEIDRDCLADYARRHQLSWLEDPMNDSSRFDRAWLRTRILPAVRERWPAAGATVARSAAHLAQASRLLAEMAAADAAGVMQDGRLAIEGLARLSPDRQVNLVRWWLRSSGLRTPPAGRLGSALRALLEARRDGAPSLRWDDGELRRYRGRLYALSPLAPRPVLTPTSGACAMLDLGPGLGRFSLVAGEQGGLCARRSAGAAFRFRAGGESLRPHPDRPRKRLKDLCQEAGIVPWMRDRLPLVYVGDRLAAVGDLWIDAEFAVPPGQPALKPVWAGRPLIY
jgi:tRNA(Ile)-lysidine synthase